MRCQMAFITPKTPKTPKTNYEGNLEIVEYVKVIFKH